MNIKKYTEEELNALTDETHYVRINKMSEEEIEKLAESDADSGAPSEEQLKKLQKVRMDNQ